MTIIHGNNTKGLGHLLATCKPERQDETTIDEKIAALEPLLVQAQLKAALERAKEHGLELLENDGPQAVRAFMEKIHLIAGDRRTKAVNVELDRRGS